MCQIEGASSTLHAIEEVTTTWPVLLTVLSVLQLQAYLCRVQAHIPSTAVSLKCLLLLFGSSKYNMLSPFLALAPSFSNA